MMNNYKNNSEGLQTQNEMQMWLTSSIPAVEQIYGSQSKKKASISRKRK